MTRRRTMFGEGADEGPAARSRRRPRNDLDITPMIDVTFLLLIFFMVTSTMKGTPDVDVPVARHGVGVDTPSATIITVKAPRAGGSETPTIVLGEGRGPEGDLEDVRTYVDERLADGISQVIVKADREVPHGFVQEVTKVVNSVEGVRFHIGVQDRKHE